MPQDATGTLQKVTVKGFRSLREVTVEFPTEVTVLVGANGSGKSNFVHALELSGKLVDSQLQDSIMRWGGFSPQLFLGFTPDQDAKTIDIELWEEPRTDREGKTVSNGYAFKLEAASDDQALMRERFYCWRTQEDEAPFDSGWGQLRRESSLAKRGQESEDDTTSHLVRKHLRALVAGLQVFHFDDTSMNAPPGDQRTSLRRHHVGR